MISLHGTTYTNPLLVFALQSECGNEFSDFRIAITGIGKVNAAYALMKSISLERPDIIINCGTAGSTDFKRGEIICCTGFLQRDMEVSALGFSKFQTPFDDIPVLLNNGIELPQYPHGICGTGDSFEQEHRNTEYNVIDMEAYAFAKISLLEQIPFLCLKYITDGADGNAAADWQDIMEQVPAQLRSAVNPLLT